MQSTTGATRPWLRPFLVGLALGLVVGTLGTVLMIPIGQPDAAEVPFGLGTLINIAAAIVAYITWRQRPRLAGFSVGIIGGWVLFWFVLLQFPPFNTL